MLTAIASIATFAATLHPRILREMTRTDIPTFISSPKYRKNLTFAKKL